MKISIREAESVREREREKENKKEIKTERRNFHRYSFKTIETFEENENRKENLSDPLAFQKKKNDEGTFNESILSR